MLRKVQLPDGSIGWFHMFYADKEGIPLALIELFDGSLTSVPAVDIKFKPSYPRLLAETKISRRQH